MELLSPFFPEFLFDARKHHLPEPEVRGINRGFDKIHEVEGCPEFLREGDGVLQGVLGVDGKIDRDEDRPDAEVFCFCGF